MDKNKLLPGILFLVRLYVGLQWLEAGLSKITSSVWTGDKAGAAISGFLNSSLAKTGGEHPDVQWWYAEFIKNIALPNKVIFSYLVSYGELLVGIALILGIFTSFAAMAGIFMNFNYLFAGAVSTNPILLIGELIIVYFRRRASVFGFDKFVQTKIKSYNNKR